MENKDNRLCSLCLCPLWDRSCEGMGDDVKKLLDVIFINKNWWMDKCQTICHLCSRKIQDNFNFKCTCIYTEDFLVPFVSTIGGPQIDLCQIYNREIVRIVKSETNTLNCQKVCRLCLEIITGHATSLLEESKFDMVQKYLPEIMLHNTSDPVACDSCVKQLHNFATFIIDCLSIQGKKNRELIGATCTKKEEYSKVEGYKKKAEKTEGCSLSINVKREDDDREGKQLFKDLNFRTVGDVSATGDCYSKSSYLLPPPVLKLENTENIMELTVPTIQGYDEHNYMGKTQDKDDKSRVLYDLDLRMLKTETKEPKIKVNVLDTCKPRKKLKQYDCQHCGYHTTYASALKSHMLHHMDPSEIKFYHCEKCKYQTKYRNALKSHELNHKLPSEVKMRKCDECPYETKHRTALVLHMLKHKKPWEITMYKCDKCEFQTKFKHALKPHKVKHEPAVIEKVVHVAPMSMSNDWEQNSICCR